VRIDSQLEIDEQELEVLTTTSRGPGGQHVNRSETRVVLRWNVLESASLTEVQRARILDRLGSRISREGVLQVAAEDHRSQTRNRELARERLASLLAEALKQERLRKATKPTRASRKKRVDDKKKRGVIKERRRKPSTED
jgi:ribosome-associated protein